MSEASTTPLSSVDPRARLPELSSLKNMSLPERRNALAKWIAWLNGNRHMAPEGVEEKLDLALAALERDQVPGNEKQDAQDDFDDWIERLGASSVQQLDHT